MKMMPSYVRPDLTALTSGELIRYASGTVVVIAEVSPELASAVISVARAEANGSVGAVVRKAVTRYVAEREVRHE